MSDLKYDHDKPRLDLLPPISLWQIAEVLSYGAKKYKDNGWRDVDNGLQRYYAAALRHLLAWKNGENVDQESGLPHIAHAACNLVFMVELDHCRRAAEIEAASDELVEQAPEPHAWHGWSK